MNSDDSAVDLDMYGHGTLVIWPPDDVRRVVNALRARYDPTSAATCEAHITLTQPFLARPGELSWKLIAAILTRFERLCITYGPLRIFLPYPCVYVAVEPIEHVHALRNALHDTGLFNLSLPFTDGFVPHMTISDTFIGVERTREVYAELRSGAVEGTFESIDIVYIRPDDRVGFSVARRLRLGQ